MTSSNELMTHGFQIGIQREADQFFLYIKAEGKLTHADYETITPVIDAALGAVDHPHVRVLVDANQLQGWAPRAAWDDFKIGLRHGSEFEKIAIFGHERWQQLATRVGNWFVSGEVRYFDNEAEARCWLQQASPEALT